MPRAITRTLWRTKAMKPTTPLTAAKNFFITPPLGAKPTPAVTITALAVPAATNLAILALLLDLRLRRRSIELPAIQRRHLLGRRRVLLTELFDPLLHAWRPPFGAKYDILKGYDS